MFFSNQNRLKFDVPGCKRKLEVSDAPDQRPSICFTAKNSKKQLLAFSH
jgi:hypothetical protein